MSTPSVNTASIGTGCTDTVALRLPTLDTDTVPLLPKNGPERVKKLTNGQAITCESSRASQPLTLPARAPRIRVLRLRKPNLCRLPAEIYFPDSPPIGQASWSYEEAFARNRGLITPKEQQRLRDSRVAIAGMGGIGGIDLVTLARLGIGRFTIADPGSFEATNSNRQYGAARSTIGHSKAEVMADIVRDINPEADLRVFTDPIDAENAGDFLRGADLFIDAIEFFEIDVRRLLFRMAASQGIYAITAGPVGFSAIWIVFDPCGMSFDSYFDVSEGMDQLEKLVAFGVGVAPKATQRSYMDLEALDIGARTGPSSSVACHVAAGAMGCQAVKILLGKGNVRPAPYYHQFDPFVGRFVHGRLRGGNRHPMQRIKRWWLTRYMRRRATRCPTPSQ